MTACSVGRWKRPETMASGSSTRTPAVPELAGGRGGPATTMGRARGERFALTAQQGPARRDYLASAGRLAGVRFRGTLLTSTSSTRAARRSPRETNPAQPARRSRPPTPLGRYGGAVVAVSRWVGLAMRSVLQAPTTPVCEGDFTLACRATLVGWPQRVVDDNGEDALRKKPPRPVMALV
jgi:hypothetical protein